MTGSRLGASWIFAIYLISPTVAFQAIHAMETPLFILLLVLTFFFSFKAVKLAPAFHQRGWVCVGVSYFLAGLTRPEGFFFGGLILVFAAVYLLCKHWSPGLAWSIVKSLTASLFIPFVAYLARRAKLGDEELEELAQLVEQLQSQREESTP